MIGEVEDWESTFGLNGSSCLKLLIASFHAVFAAVVVSGWGYDEGTAEAPDKSSLMHKSCPTRAAVVLRPSNAGIGEHEFESATFVRGRVIVPRIRSESDKAPARRVMTPPRWHAQD